MTTKTKIIFTKHAEDKFAVLLRHKVKLSRSFVIKTVREPELIDRSRLPLLIAQRRFDANRVLRVVYKKEEDRLKIITFYPGRRSQYEKNR